MRVFAVPGLLALARPARTGHTACMDEHDAFVAAPEHSLELARLQADFNREFDAPCPPVPVLARRLEAMLAGDRCFAVAAGAGRGLVGHALVTLRPTIYFDGPLAALDELYVQPALRGCGLGSAIMRCLLLELQRRGSLELHINVDEDDTGARRFYERHGFANREPDSSWRMLLYYQELPPAR